MLGKRVRWFGLLSLFAIACSGNSGDSDGVDPSTPLSSLNDDEKAAACDQLVVELEQSWANYPSLEACTGAAILSSRTAATDDASLREACVTRRDECVQDSTFDFSQAECNIPETCTLSVNDIVACYDDLVSLASSVYAGVPACETLTLAVADAYTPALGTELPPSCQQVQSLCSNDDDEPDDSDPLIQACTASCERFETTCGVVSDPTCSAWCGTEQSLGERNGCLDINQSFYECGRSAELDCEQQSVRLAIDHACGLADVTYCQLNQGVTCGRVEAFDSYCADALPDLPEGFQCVSSVPYGQCMDHPTYGSPYRCCPAGTTF